MIRSMSTLSAFIKTHPEKSMAQWAEDFGVSRPHLYCLIDGTRQPSLPVAQRIAAATGNAVPITAWSNIAAIVKAAQPAGGAP